MFYDIFIHAIYNKFTQVYQSILLQNKIPFIMTIGIYLFRGESPAMFPIAQRAYSATIGNLLFSNCTNKGMPPISIMV